MDEERKSLGSRLKERKEYQTTQKNAVKKEEKNEEEVWAKRVSLQLEFPTWNMERLGNEGSVIHAVGNMDVMSITRNATAVVNRERRTYAILSYILRQWSRGWREINETISLFDHLVQ